MKTHRTIIKSVVTEKATTQQANAKYTFVVNKNATKVDVKHTIKEFFGADVATVRMMIVPAKSRNLGKRLFKKRPSYKKAIITLKEGQTIDPNKVIETKSTKK